MTRMESEEMVIRIGVAVVVTAGILAGVPLGLALCAIDGARACLRRLAAP